MRGFVFQAAAAKPLSMSNALTTPEFWRDEFWKLDQASDLPDVTFDPRGLEFRAIDALLKRWLPRDGQRHCLEIGCHPGRYLWYFHDQFGYQVSGIEYVADACDSTREALQRAGVAAEIRYADVFDFDPPGAERYDVVVSVGLVEHFVDIGPIVRRHVELLGPGGHVVVIVPNHRGLNGCILRTILPAAYARHNRMRYADLLAAVRACQGVEVLWGGYVGRFNLAPTNFCPWAQSRFSSRAYRWVDRLHRWAMRCSRFMPDSRLWSPYAMLIGRKSEPQR
jgi:2-polyprenyl-3-methyl-5-hydroxy-6-metoxy-1,4-benzoquinol methylase